MAQVFSEVQPDSPEPLDGVGYNTSVPSDPDVEPHAIMELPDGYVDSRSQRRLSVLIRCGPHNARRFIGLQIQKEE